MTVFEGIIYLFAGMPTRSFDILYNNVTLPAVTVTDEVYVTINLQEIHKTNNKTFHKCIYMSVWACY